MADEAQLTGGISRKLDAVHATVQDLSEMADAWEGLAAGERAAWSLDWDHLMADYLTELDEHARAGHMTPTQQAEYGELLAGARALIERLNLYRPPVALDPPRNLKIAAG